MKTIRLLLERGYSNVTQEEIANLLDWRVVDEGTTAEGRDTHDEDGNLIIALYRDRHIVDGFMNTLCEFVHEPDVAKLISASPLLAAALEHVNVQEDGTGAIDAEGMKYVKAALKKLGW